MSWRRWILVLALITLLSACDLLGGGEEDPSVSPEPEENRVVFTAPYRAVLDEGETVPGARLQYVGKDDEGILVRIDGQNIHKKSGDSFNWRGAALLNADGSTASGVELDFNLRVVGVVLDVFQAWGDVDIIVSDPAPVRSELPEDAPLVFSAAVASYAVARGEFIPGTTYTYLGKSEKGAEFGGVEGYPYREVADSLDWSGQIRSNVFVDLTMRVSTIQDEEATLLGTATIWLFP